MKKIILYYLLMQFILVCFSLSVFAETYYAKKAAVKVTSAKSPMSGVVYVLKKGDQVDVMEKAGRSYKVKLENGKIGWVFKFKLSTRKPKGGGGGSGALAGLTGGSNISAKEARSGGSIRGLKEVSKNYASNKKIDPSHVKSVERMEKFKVSDQELTAFKKDGSIGEFSGGGL